MKKVTILGGGVTGCVLANELTKRNCQVTLIEKENYVGGGCRTFFYGGHPYTDGPRPLTYQDESAYQYINKIVPMKKFHLVMDTYIERDASFYSYPIHEDDISRMPDKQAIYEELKNRPAVPRTDNFEQGWVDAVGPTLYDKYIKNYTQKMWKIPDNSIFSGFDWSVKKTPTQKEPIRKGKRVSEVAAYPIEETGFNNFFEYCVRDARVILGKEVTRVDLEKKIVYLDGEKLESDLIFSTIAIDDLMQHCYGELKYMGRDYWKLVLPVEHVFPDGHHFMYYPNQEPFTRVVEYKNLTQHKSDSTLLILEVPSHSNKLYVYNTKEEREKANKYRNSLPSGVYSIGRLGTYSYINITDCILSVWKLLDSICAG